jgi:hypothetical protein
MIGGGGHGFGVRSADTGAAVSVAAAGWAVLANINVVLETIAAVVAIVAGLLSAYYYYKSSR